MTSSRHVQHALTHLFDAFNAHDADLACAGYAPDVRFRSHARGTELVGVDAVHASHLRSFAASSDIRADVLEIIDAGDVVVFEFEISGTDDGVVEGREPTGRRFRFRMCDVVRFDEQGRITSEDNYSDRLTRMEQLGLTPG